MVSIRRRRDSESPSGSTQTAGDDLTAPIATTGPRETPPAPSAAASAPQQTATYAAVPRQGGQDAPAAPAAQAAPVAPVAPARAEWPTPERDGVPREQDAIGDPAYERFGGVNIGAAFFGWMVALGMTVLLTAIAGGAALALGVTRVEFDAQSLGTGSYVSAAVVVVVLVVAYYCGGYVAGRMSRFDGARQGFAVWALALLFAVLGGLAGWAAGERWGGLSTRDLPSVQVSTSDLTTGGLIAAAVVLVVTLLAALAGGKVGHRYHAKVDRAL